MSIRDITLGDTIDIKFNTCEPDTGAPITLAGTPVISAYVGNSTTEITAGITLTTDFDSRVGLHNVRVVASSGNGYTTGTDVTLVITTGTVDGVSAVGVKVGEFTIGRGESLALRPTTAGRTLDVSTGGNAGIDLDNVVITNGSGAFGIQASGTLSGTHSATTADLGTNAPSTDIAGMTLTVPSKNFSRLVSSYNTGTGVATFDTTAVTLANADQWYLFGTAPSASGGGGLDAAGVRAAIGLASANLDTQLSTIDNFIDTEIAALPAAVVTAMYAQEASNPLSVNVVGWNGLTVDPLQDAAEHADVLLSTLQADYLVSGTIGASISAGGLDAAGIRAAVGLSSADLGTRLTTIDDFLDTEIAAIKVKTDFLPSATAGSAGGLFIAGTNAATTITTGLTANITGNVTGNITGNLSGSVGSVTGLTTADVALIKAKTDQLTFTKTNELDANIQSINGVTITGNGSTGNEFSV